MTLLVVRLGLGTEPKNGTQLADFSRSMDAQNGLHGAAFTRSSRLPAYHWEGGVPRATQQTPCAAKG
jgi:hypothetical protein